MKKPGDGFSTFELLIIFVVAALLATFVASKYSAVRQARHDEKRKNDVASIQLAIQSYWAQTGNFPSLAQMNDPSFQKKSLNNLQTSAIRDPLWSAKNKFCRSNGSPVFENSSSPNKGCYGYSALPAGCDNKATACSGYLLNARLETGGFYGRSST